MGHYKQVLRKQLPKPLRAHVAGNQTTTVSARVTKDVETKLLAEAKRRKTTPHALIGSYIDIGLAQK